MPMSAENSFQECVHASSSFIDDTVQLICLWRSITHRCRKESSSMTSMLFL